MHMRRRQIPAGLKGFLLRDVIRRKEFRDDKVSSSAKRWGRRGKQVKYGKEEIFFDKAAAAIDDANSRTATTTSPPNESEFSIERKERKSGRAE